ncbi:mitochondrial nicotinamide adenine dinucleotide transporter SLC25A51-like [Saccostrea echinata]|uniref:mitochondrial nicotinamide adenine dinucleotide transporter SLC25A51-like n=1 Tax=Saccostrea echinata TaxID=191078 RepID=UPI002A83A274|nr:mitochondrial nicotinamide adenine dinucleotide transporter SLC25A51-like [Saccostrea echinata]
MVLSESEDSSAEFVCGWGSAFVNITVTFPINKVMFRQQLLGVRTFAALRQLQTEGLSNLYRGFFPPLIQKTASMTLMFGIYYKSCNYLNKQYPQTPYFNSIVSATFAGALEALLLPFERIQVLMQDKNYNHRFENARHAAKELRSIYGVKEFYRGGSAILLRNCGSNILFFLGRDYLMNALPHPDTVLERTTQDFICGAALGAFLSTLFYPVNVVKVKMQSKVGGTFEGLVHTLRIVQEERKHSIRKLFRGVHINFTRSFLSWGIVNATYEFLMVKLFSRSSRKNNHVS